MKKTVYAISKYLNWLGEGVLVALMLATIANVVLRKLKIGTPGLYEMNLVFGLILYVTTWVHTEVLKGHVNVDLILERMSRTPKAITLIIGGLLSFGTCMVAAWFTARYAYQLLVGKEVFAPFLPIPSFIFAYIVALSFVLLGIVILLGQGDAVNSLRKRE